MKSLNNLECVTLFVDDLSRARTFYEAVSDARPIYSDAVCSVIGLGGVMVNLLQETEARSSCSRSCLLLQAPDLACS